MSIDHERYRDWDAPYILGSLSSTERREYERHLAECAECEREVAELAGLPGLLSGVPRDAALALIEPDAVREPTSPSEESPVTLGSLVDLVSRRRRRARVRIAAAMAATAVAAAGIALVVPLAFGAGVSGDAVADGSSASGHSVALAAEPGVSVEAEVTFIPEAWGTRIEMDCAYAELGGDDATRESAAATSATDPGIGEGGAMDPVLVSATSTDADSLAGSASTVGYGTGDATKKWQYVMYLRDQAGSETAIGSWTSTPGSTMHPSLSTGLTLAEIASVEVRLAGTDELVLTGAP